MRFTKAEILQAFDREDRSYRIAILCSHWLQGSHYTPSAIDDARGLLMQVRGEWQSFADLGDRLASEPLRSLTVADFVLNQLHALIRTPLALLTDYCHDYDKAMPSGGLAKRLMGQSWYEFARINRNAISHNFRYEFENRDRKVLPVTWNGLTISADMDGQQMRYEFLWHKPGHELFFAMRDFAAALPIPPPGAQNQKHGAK